MSEFKKVFAQLKTITERLKSEIHELDALIADASKRREVIISTAVSKEDFIAYIRADIRDKGKRFWSGMRTLIEQRPKEYPALERGIGLDYLSGAIRSPEIVPPSAFFFYFGDLIAERISRAIDEDLDWPNGTMPVTERKVIVAKIDAEIADLRKQRKELADQLIEAGLAG